MGATVDADRLRVLASGVVDDPEFGDDEEVDAAAAAAAIPLLASRLLVLDDVQFKVDDDDDDDDDDELISIGADATSYRSRMLLSGVVVLDAERTDLHHHVALRMPPVLRILEMLPSSSRFSISDTRATGTCKKLALG
jgi:hypothetical protein